MLAQGCGHGMLVPGAREHLLGDEGFLGSSFLVVLALDAVGLVQGPRALEPGHLLGEEVVEAPPDPRLLRGMEGKAARRTARGAPCGADELGDAGKPVLVEVVDGVVVQELSYQDQRGVRIRGGTTCMG